jgi:hypothetical protein
MSTAGLVTLAISRDFQQGCQMVYFQTKNPNLGRGFEWKMMLYFCSICHLPYFMANWYIFWLFGIFCPALVSCRKKNLATLINQYGTVCN